MVANTTTVSFQGIEVQPIDVQVHVSPGLPKFVIVGLADKAVAESKERVKAALHAIGLALPPDHITVNLSPADIQKEGSHYDLPIALALLVKMGVLPADEMRQYTSLGELALDGSMTSVAGALPAAIDALSRGHGLICPEASGGEAAWAEGVDVLAAPSLLAIINHFKGSQVLSPPTPSVREYKTHKLDLIDIKGQESAKRALEVAAAGGHNMLMVGPPGSGKSMLASRLPGILPELTAEEALEVTMIHSVAGKLLEGQLLKDRPFRDPHHSASLPALVGGGMRVQPGEISLAHMGVLFLDELPEFSRTTLEALRQPLESGRATIARANAHVTFPARVQLVAAMNPCRCGHMDDVDRACSRAPKCGVDYQSKISGPLIDRIDIQIDVPAVTAQDLSLPKPREGSVDVARRVAAARNIQQARFATYNGPRKPRTNAEVEGKALEEIATPEAAGLDLLTRAAEKFKLSARGYHRVLKLARTLADLENSKDVRYTHVAEALSYRRAFKL